MIFRITRYSEVSFEVTKIGYDVRAKEYVGKVMGKDYKYVHLDKAVSEDFKESEVIPLLMKEGLAKLEDKSDKGKKHVSINKLIDRSGDIDTREYQKYGV